MQIIRQRQSPAGRGRWLTIQNTPAHTPQHAAPKRTNHSVPNLLFVYRPAANAELDDKPLNGLLTRATYAHNQPLQKQAQT